MQGLLGEGASLRGPGQQFGVQAGPVGGKAVEEGALRERVREEGAAGASVDAAALAVGDAEPGCGHSLAAAYDDDGAGAHVFLLDDDPLDPHAAEVGEGFGRMFQRALAVAGL